MNAIIIFSIFTTLAAVATAFATIKLAYSTRDLVSATKVQIKESSRTTWRNNVIATVAEFFGILDSLQNCTSHDELISHANIEKLQCIRKKIKFLLEDKDDTLEGEILILIKKAGDLFYIKDNKEYFKKVLPEQIEYQKLEDKVFKRIKKLINEY